MAEVVDSIIAELIGRDNGYITTFERAIAKHREFTKSIPKVDGLVGLAAGAQRYADQHGQAIGKAARAEEQASQQIKKARKSASDAAKTSAKEQSDAAKAAAQAEQKYYAQGPKIFEAKARQFAALARASEAAAAGQVAAAKRAADAEAAAGQKASAAFYAQGPKIFEAKAKQYAALARAAEVSSSAQADAAKKATDAEIIQAQRAERAAAVAQRAADRSAAGLARGTGASFGATQPAGYSRVPASVVPAEKPPVAEEREVNHLLADRFDLQQRAKVAEGQIKRELQDEIGYLARINTYRRAGLSDEQAIARAQRETAFLDAERAKVARGSSGGKGLRQFAEGATLGYGAPIATLGGIAIAAAIAGVTTLAKKGLEYASSLKQQSDQLGLTTHDLQIYQTAAAQVGVTTDQFREAASQLAQNLGKAQEGSQEQSKFFKALRIDIGNSKDGYKSLSDILPTLSDRLSKIPDKARRLAIESALGGEQLKKLDPILSGGAASFDKLAASIESAGGVLSDEQIQNADRTAVKLKLLGDQLERDLSSTVANNAESIERLATAFFRAADGALKFFDAFQVRGNLAVLNQQPDFFDKIDQAFPLLGRFDRAIGTGPATGQDRNGAFSTLLTMKSGRDALLARNTAALNELERVDRYKKVLAAGGTPDGSGSLDTTVPGLFDTSDTATGRFAAQQRLLGERRRIRAAIQTADRGQQRPAAQPGAPGDLSKLFAPKGKAGDTPEKAAARQKAYEDQLAQYQEQELRARAQLTGDVSKQAEIEKGLVDRHLDRLVGYKDANGKLHAGDIDLEVQAKRIDASKAEELKAAARSAAAQEKLAIDVETSAKLAAVDAAHAQTSHDIQNDLLSSQVGLAKTAAERLEIQLRILANDKANERRQLEDQLKQLKPGDAARADVKARLDAVDEKYDAQEKAARRQNQGPLKDYMESLPRSATQLNEALEQAAASGLANLNDGLATAIGNFLHLHGVAGQFLQDLIKIGLQRMIIGPLADALFPSGGGLLKSIGSIFTGGARAAGGSVVGGVPYLVGEKRPEVFVPPVSGTIRPDAAVATGGGMTVVQPLHFHAEGAVLTQALLAQANSFAASAADQAAQFGAHFGTMGGVSEVKKAASRPTLPRSMG